jgi:hypothetical protein
VELKKIANEYLGENVPRASKFRFVIIVYPEMKHRAKLPPAPRPISPIISSSSLISSELVALLYRRAVFSRIFSLELENLWAPSAGGETRRGIFPRARDRRDKSFGARPRTP